MKRLSTLSLLLIWFLSAFAEKADFIIFSFDRPLQLYALLESTERYVTGIESVQVVFRASNELFAQAYREVSARFPHVLFYQQGADPHADFKPLTIRAFYAGSAPYVLFGVDDIVVKDYVDIELCTELLKQYDAYGFYLRLGLHLTDCYSENVAQRLPPLSRVDSMVYAWQFKYGAFDWGYPNTVDMTIYLKRDIEGVIKSLDFHSPNMLEARWACRQGEVCERTGLCFEETKIVNLPLNLVQTYWKNRHQDLFSAEQLLELFNAGFKMDIGPLFRVENKAAHMEYEPTFIER